MWHPHISANEETSFHGGSLDRDRRDEQLRRPVPRWPNDPIWHQLSRGKPTQSLGNKSSNLLVAETVISDPDLVGLPSALFAFKSLVSFLFLRIPCIDCITRGLVIFDSASSFYIGLSDPTVSLTA